MRLKQKVTIITGANSGIGHATALRFASEGAVVVIAARNQPRGQAVVSEIESTGGNALFVPLDVRLPEQCERVIAQTISQFGRLDVVVNNAGIILRNRNVLHTTYDEWDDTFDINVKGTFNMSKVALPHLITSRGNIVNMSSYLGLVGATGLAAYCASKGAIIQLTRAMALDHAADGIRVNCVCPGSVHTPMIEAAWEQYGEGAEQLWKNKHPVGRVARADEVADAILYLASSESSFVTGVALPVDGGITAG